MTNPLDAYDTADDGLAIWHPSLDEEIDDDYLDWGTAAPGSSDDRPIRIRNGSADYTAAAIIVAVADPLDPAQPTAAADHMLSADDGATFAAQAAIGDLPPHAVSSPIILRRITGPGTPAGERAFLLTATAGDWIPAGAIGEQPPDDVLIADAPPPGDEGDDNP